MYSEGGSVTSDGEIREMPVLEQTAIELAMAVVVLSLHVLRAALKLGPIDKLPQRGGV